MSKAFRVAFAVALLVIGFLVWRGFVNTAGNHIEPAGKIGKVRALKVDDNEMIAIVDFNVRNDADIPVVVRSIEAQMEAADGSKVTGGIVAAADLGNFFRNYPAIGEQYNPPLKARDTVKGHDSVDRMVGVRFDVSEDAFDKRKGVVLRVEDITGPVLEMRAK